MNQKKHMKKLVSFAYKSLWLLSFLFRCQLCTSIFKMKLWINNVHFGKKVKAGGGSIPVLRISPYTKLVQLGNNVVFNNFNDAGWNSCCSIWTKRNAILIIGNGTGLNGVLLYAKEKIIIGNNVKIGGGTRIIDTDFHPLNYELRKDSSLPGRSAPIIIKDDAFIGTACIILKGVTIGNRSIVAAGSIVTKSIPDFELWGGNPAHFIRKIDNE